MRPAGSSLPTLETIASSCLTKMDGHLPSGEGLSGVLPGLEVVRVSLRHLVGLVWGARRLDGRRGHWKQPGPVACPNRACTEEIS